MPGTPSIRWNESNKAKAYDAIVFYENVKVSSETAEKVAKFVGMFLDSAESYLLFTSLLRMHSEGDPLPASGPQDQVRQESGCAR